ncbi:MAG: hypothetical protein JJU11_18345, partial [Candidatus Sumerlaeia bacterium]|nr:hypothetical protein [Candidatus Sumerlaeia bacterium]
AMAAVCGTPFLALEYQPKVRDFSESIGMGEYTISTAEREPDKLVGLVSSLAANQGPVRALLTGEVTKNRERILQFSHRVRHHFSSIHDKGLQGE